MKIEVDVEKKWVFMILVGILILAGAIFVYANYPYSNTPNPGHGADTIQVNLANNVEKTLQDAIDNGDLGGNVGGSYNATWTPLKPTLKSIVNQNNANLVLTGPASTASEVLVNVNGYMVGDQAQNNHAVYWNIHTTDGTNKYANKFILYQTANNFKYDSNSDTFWLPIISDKTIYFDHTTWDGATITLEVIGYR